MTAQIFGNAGREHMERYGEGIILFYDLFFAMLGYPWRAQEISEIAKSTRIS